MSLRLGLLVLVGALALAPPATAAPRHDGKARTLARSHAAAGAGLERARALRDGRGVVTGRELTPALAQLAARYEALDRAGRREAERLLARPTDGAGDPQGDGYTVAEHAPHCTASFCLHWVTSTVDAPPLADSDGDDVPDYVEQMATEFEFVRARQNGEFGWRMPVADGARGGDARLDVYLIELAGTGILGYAATDLGQGDPHEKFAYMVMDDDYAGSASPAEVLQVTAAHEYNHVLQFAYDALQDAWMFESTAIWMEDRVYDDVDHYLGFIAPWAALDEIPLARNFRDKHYGSGVWNMWLEERHDAELVRDVWEGSTATAPASFAPAAYDAALTAAGPDGFSASFTHFSAALAEWRTATQFPEGGAYADAQRRGALQVAGPAVRPLLDHTTYALFTVPQPAAGWPPVVRLDGELPSGVAGGLALVGRTGADQQAGAVATSLQQLPDGGAGSVQLEDPAAYGRVTAVLVNADFEPTGFAGGDWTYAAEDQPFTAAAGASESTASAPASTGPPSVSGTPRDGSTLSAANGTWSGSAPMTYARRWRRCTDATPASCDDIEGAAGASYTAGEADVGARLRVRVTASNAVSSAAAESAPTEPVAAVAPANATPPAIDDLTPAIGETLHATDGTWTGSRPLAIEHQWRRCTTTGLPSCIDVEDATDPAYTVAAEDEGHFLRVRVTATNTAGSAVRDSAVTAKVPPPTPLPPDNTVAPAVSGTPRDGETLTAADGTWTGSPALTRRWLRCADAGIASCAETAATGATYVLAAGDVGSRMRVRVRGENGAGFEEVASAATAPVAAVAPAAVEPPQVAGVARDGELLTAIDGTWSGTAPSFTRQWRRCDAACADIAGATSPGYRLTPADVGHAVRVRVTATNAAGAVSSDSAPTATVAAIPVANAIAPAISGALVQGSVLTAADGSWTGTPPIAISRRWQRCTGGELTCADIAGQTGASYTTQPIDVMRQLRVVVTAAGPAGPVSVASALFGPVTAVPAGGGGGDPPPPPPAPPAAPPLPPPPAALAPLSASVKAPARGRLAAALGGKLAVTVTCSAACRIAARIELPRKAARKLRLAPVLARGARGLAAAGQARIGLRFTAKARKRLRRARRLTARLVVETRDATGALAARSSGGLALRR